MGKKKKKSPGLKGSLETLIQFARDQGWDEVDVVEAYCDLELALEQGEIKFSDE